MHRLEQDKVYKHFIERTRLGRWHKTFLYGLVALLWLTGVVWLAFHFLGARGGDAFGATMSPMQPLAMKIHGAAAMAFMVVLGSLVPVHMRRAWALRRNRASGVIIVSTCATLIATGWALYYLAGENTRTVMSIAHWAIGLALPVIVYLHILAWRWQSREADRAT